MQNFMVQTFPAIAIVYEVLPQLYQADRYAMSMNNANSAVLSMMGPV